MPVDPSGSAHSKCCDRFAQARAFSFLLKINTLLCVTVHIILEATGFVKYFYSCMIKRLSNSWA